MAVGVTVIIAVVAPTLVGPAAAADRPALILLAAKTLPPPERAIPSFAPGQPSATASGNCYRLPRATKDRPDVQEGRLIHVIYLLHSDFRDESLDTRGIIDCSARAQNEWFQEASEGLRWRFDTFETKVKVGGKLKRVEATDVTFVRSKLMAIALANAFDVADELKKLGFFDPNKRYLSFVASESASCGDAIYPIGAPTSAQAPVDGKYAQVYLFSDEACGAHDFGPPGAVSFAEMIAQQELIHNDGLTSLGAPHGCLGGVPPGIAHVCTGPLFLTEGNQNLDPERVDVMYPYISVPLSEKILDRGNDDYFRHPFPHLGDLEDSPYLEPASSMKN